MEAGVNAVDVSPGSEPVENDDDVEELQIDLDKLKSWVSDKDSAELKAKLQPFWDVLNMKLTDRIIEGPDKLRLIISPLGESIWKILNDSKEIKKKPYSHRYFFFIVHTFKLCTIIIYHLVVNLLVWSSKVRRC